jgi:serine/threonine protein kinase
VTQKIGGGTYGSVYEGFNIRTGEEVAIKMEAFEAVSPMLFMEYQRYLAVNSSGEIFQRSIVS